MSRERDCPYNVRIDQMTQNIYEYNSDGTMSLATVKLVEKQRPMPCTRKKCGAWRWGRCARKS